MTAIAVTIVTAACSSAEPAPNTTTTATTLPASAASGTGTTTTTTEANNGAEGFRTRTPGVLVVGTERLTSPWYTGPSPGEITGGLEYRLGQEIGARLGAPVVKVVSTSLVLMMTGQDCKCDVIISGVTITDSLARTLDLTEPYLDADQALVVRRGTSVTSLTAAASLRLAAAVHNPSGLDAIRTQIKPAIDPAVVADDDEALRRVADGRLDGFVLDAPSALALAVADPSFAVAGKIRTDEQLAVALNLGSPNTAFVNAVIRDMRDDGTIGNLLTSYLGERPADLPFLPA